MKAVILAGGLGTRISEESHLRPKPMIEIGGMPILWHIMKILSTQGITEFVICAGYKQEVIKDWFADYYLHTSDVTFDLTNGGRTTVHRNTSEAWKVTVADTGYATMTGGRLKKIKHYVGDETFLMTYGDGVANVNISDLVAYHQLSGTKATLTAVHATQRFGVLDMNDSGLIREFREKHDRDGSYINGGFMILEPEVLDYIESDSTIFESDTLFTLAQKGELGAYRHEGFWQCMDMQREKQLLEDMWAKGNAPWKIW
ncbi:glucose-1-phosphate cytidylyltransferase [Cryptobacterium curtum DSM 15641]|uniref:Glucose-1-phosphate cytidylyltransferase n=1 Tax=Cryptobacterium curtum (strain ATCC 700683 / DSM 15641 / CCUG 43107 / 12-3) TaxID=469378 RepID=C7MP91_CRYCD|nr:glucose-1-phosphate cytidylyltransferase [Cryptobacterium curtum]ACU94731.1 glucose-1-phosphate cytidylyltransferase [Cryptobacterium curtum DSM 15641]